jgi:CheY-like chemotaxis protein
MRILSTTFTNAYVFNHAFKRKKLVKVGLRVLIVEDTPERQKILKNLFRDHAWVLVHTARRALILLEHFDFDLLSLDYDLAGPEKGSEIASYIAQLRKEKIQVLIHSMNSKGAQQIIQILPHAVWVPISKMVKNNRIFKNIREGINNRGEISWLNSLMTIDKRK